MCCRVLVTLGELAPVACAEVRARVIAHRHVHVLGTRATPVGHWWSASITPTESPSHASGPSRRKEEGRRAFLKGGRVSA